MGAAWHTDFPGQVCLRQSKLRSTCLLSNIFNLFNHCIYSTHTYTYTHTYMPHMYSCAGEIKMSAPLCPLGSISINSGVWRECPPMHWELSCLWYHLAPWELTALAQDSVSPESQPTISTLHSCTSSTRSVSARHQQHICDCPNTVDYRKQSGKSKACHRHGMGQPR